jgi:thiamine-phosphate pyrophosphorylase
MSASAPTAVRARIAGLYALTPELADTELLVTRVTAAIAGGAAAVQYRNKLGSAALRRAQAQALRALCGARGVTFIVNDDVELAQDIAADGVHLGRSDAAIAAARQRLGDAMLIGASCYDSLERAQGALAGGADYVAFGSFFSSQVKPEAVRAQPSLLTAAKARWSVPVVAIGGITAANAPALLAAGADALAVITALFDAPDIAAAARALCAAWVRLPAASGGRERPIRSAPHA